MNQARNSRRSLLAEIQSKQQVEARDETVRSQFWHLLGGRPEETPLNPRITGSLERNGQPIDTSQLEFFCIRSVANRSFLTNAKPEKERSFSGDTLFLDLMNFSTYIASIGSENRRAQEPRNALAVCNSLLHTKYSGFLNTSSCSRIDFHLHCSMMSA
jgi:hypothetical protein